MSVNHRNGYNRAETQPMAPENETDLKIEQYLPVLQYTALRTRTRLAINATYGPLLDIRHFKGCNELSNPTL